MKPIEPGCKALLIHSVNHPELVGTVMHVVDRAPKGDLVEGRSGELHVIPGAGWWIVRTPVGLEGVTEERCLLRLDDDNDGLFVYEQREHEPEVQR